MTEVVVQISPTTLPLSVARSLTEAAIARAHQVGIPYTVTVLDGGAHIVQVTRMDGAALASIETSLAKARAAVQFGAPTADLAPMAEPGGPLHTAASSFALSLTFVAGGVPVKDAAGLVIGSVGAGGGSPGQDHEIATAAVGAL
jgi:uncharacterized protein GlcG (DUF336 family)